MVICYETIASCHHSFCPHHPSWTVNFETSCDPKSKQSQQRSCVYQVLQKDDTSVAHFHQPSLLLHVRSAEVLQNSFLCTREAHLKHTDPELWVLWVSQTFPASPATASSGRVDLKGCSQQARGQTGAVAYRCSQWCRSSVVIEFSFVSQVCQLWALNVKLQYCNVNTHTHTISGLCFFL